MREDRGTVYVGGDSRISMKDGWKENEIPGGKKKPGPVKLPPDPKPKLV